MTRARRRSRGTTLIEIIIAISLVSLTGTIGAKLLFTTLSTGQMVQDAERQSRVLDRLSATLRHDVERAATISSPPGGLQIGDAAWTFDGPAVVRTCGGRVDRFPLPTLNENRLPQMWISDGRVHVSLGGDTETTWTFTPIIGRGDR